MKRSAVKSALACGALLGVFAQSATAALVVAFDRLSDTTVRMTGSGSLLSQYGAGQDIIYFDNLFSNLLNGVVNESVLLPSTVMLGSQAFGAAFTVSTGDAWTAGVSSGISAVGTSNFAMGDILSDGYLDLSIAGVSGSPIFAPGGSTGDIYWGTTAGAIAGSWTINGFVVSPTSPVPLPAAAWLFGSALLGLAAAARRKA